MNNDNTMQAVIEVDDSQEEVVYQRHGKRMAGMQKDSEASAAGQTRAWETSHERLVRMAERTAERHQRMAAVVTAAARDTETAFNRVAKMASASENAFDRVASASMRVTHGVKSAIGTITELTAGVAAGSVVVAGHAIVMDKFVNVYRAARLILSPTLFTGATLGVGIAAEYALHQALDQRRQNQVDAMVAARTGRSFASAATSGNAARILGMGVTEYREVFAGKNPAEVAQLAGEFSKLKDPVDKAAFAVQHFGDQADAALPLLGDRLKSSADRAYEFSSAMASKPREALEQLAVTLHRPAEALHALGDEFRALKLEMREGIAIKVAWVVQSWEEAQRASETARKQITARGGDPNAGTVTMGGINWGAITEKPQMSYLQVAQSLVGASSEALEKFRPTGMVGGGPSSQLVAKSQAAIDRYGATAEGLSRRLSEVQGKLRDHQDQLVRASGTAFEATIRQQIVQGETQESILKPQVEAAQRRESFAKEKLKLTQEGVGFITVGDNIIRQDAINKANQTFAAPRSLYRGANPSDALIPVPMEQDLKPGMQVLHGEAVFISPQSERNTEAPLEAARAKAIGADLDEWEKHRKEIRLAGINAETSATIRLLELRTDPGGEVETAHQVAALRQSALEQEWQLTDDIVRYRESSLHNELDLRQKLAELQHKQVDEIKNVASGLFDTLFTKPAEFGKQFLSTVKAAVLKPITEGLGDVTANILHPVIFGKDGNGGISGALHGIFGGGNHGINDVQLVNGAVPVVVMGGGSAGSSAGGFSPVGGAFSRLARMGLSLPLAAAMAMGGTPTARMSGGEAIGGGDSTAGLTQLASGLWQRGPGASGDLSAVVGMGGTGGFAGGYGGPSGTNSGGRGNPLSGILGNLKGIDWGGFTRADAGGLPGVGGQPGTDLGNTGKITGANGLLGGGLLTGGMMLAQQGLLGSSRGTWAGVGMGAAGGAMVGFQMGGPLGALIGGIAGFGIGLGEKIAGVETPEREAARLIGTIYGLSIRSDSTTIKQVVAMARQSYGGSVSIAVRSAPVRELLQLYADSTGQKSSLLTAQQIHSASLVESGNNLYQQATYSGGSPYTYASPLPTLGPTGGMIPTANPMGGWSGSIHLDQQATVDLITTGATRAISGNPRGVAAANVNGNGQSATRLTSAGQAFDPGAIWA
jgi:hypothetical protein